ncbi:MAG: hypothetical protein KKI08_05160 [Armatimonadetes bacterium]|nr:hypothetical protein [Armatimonadota bacterium]
MTSREIVRRAVEFNSPSRLPVRFASMGIDDTFGVGPAPAVGWKASQENEDEWGCVWHKPTGEVCNMGQPKGHPLAEWSHLPRLNFPDPHNPARYAHFEEALQRAEAAGKYVMIGCGFTLFERMHYLRGFENLLMDMHLHPTWVHDLAERVLAFPIGVAQEIGKRFRGRVHGFAMTDDWGTQCDTICSLTMWREFFKDRYERLFGAIHDAGMHAWMHSCGHVNIIVGEWIDCGLDVVNLQQPTNLGIEEMGRDYRGRICFESICDIQMTLPHGTDEQIRREAKLLLDHWSTPQGGFVLSDYGDGRAIGVPDDRKRLMLRAFCEMAAPELLDKIPAAT